MDSSTIQFTPAKAVQATSLVAYQSRGHCLVIGPLDTALAVAAKLNTPAQTVLVPVAGSKNINKRATEDGITVVEADALLLNGYLGAFDCAIGDPESPGSLARLANVSVLGGFDLVLDLNESSMIQTEVLPFGYLSPDEASLDEAIAELEQLQGDFEKPRYFEYDASICAHSRSSITACTRCLDVCGTGAIKSNGEGISIEPYLCQGCGSCATNCPSGAVRYAYPSPADALSQLTELLQSRKSHTKTVIYLHDAEGGAEKVATFAAELSDDVLPLAVEEVASVGIDVWLASIAYGVAAIVIDAPAEDTGAKHALTTQSNTANSILQGLDLGERIHLLDGATASGINKLAEFDYHSIPAATFQSFNDKRQTVRAATDHLQQHSPQKTSVVDLTNQAAFGEVKVDDSACTLCLACVTVCPGRALQDGETLPQLKFIESQCLQCGLCEKACPESAISLSPRYLYDSETARKPRILNEEEPFNCVVCNTPFATHRIIGRMQAKLSEHWMFKDDKALRRLKMCEDCRVKDIFDENKSGIDVHR